MSVWLLRARHEGIFRQPGVKAAGGAAAAAGNRLSPILPDEEAAALERLATASDSMPKIARNVNGRVGAMFGWLRMQRPSERRWTRVASADASKWGISLGCGIVYGNLDSGLRSDILQIRDAPFRHSKSPFPASP